VPARPPEPDATTTNPSTAGLARPAVVAALARRPDLWPTAVRAALRLAPRGWWRRSPYLPVPSREYLRFRMVTAYGGDGSHPPEPHDLVAYLEWCRAWPAVVHRS
jgi:hypothetical protein